MEENVRCAWCGRGFRAHTNLTGDDGPQEDDVTLCEGCMAPSIWVHYNGGLSLRKPTLPEYQGIVADPRVQRGLNILATIKAMEEQDEVGG